jgi:hypothetical protein
VDEPHAQLLLDALKNSKVQEHFRQLGWRVQLSLPDHVVACRRALQKKFRAKLDTAKRQHLWTEFIADSRAVVIKALDFVGELSVAEQERCGVPDPEAVGGKRKGSGDAPTPSE